MSASKPNDNNTTTPVAKHSNQFQKIPGSIQRPPDVNTDLMWQGYSSQAYFTSIDCERREDCSARNGLNVGRLAKTLFCDGHHIPGGKS